jgi:hypothetical protein
LSAERRRAPSAERLHDGPKHRLAARAWRRLQLRMRRASLPNASSRQPAGSARPRSAPGPGACATLKSGLPRHLRLTRRSRRRGPKPARQPARCAASAGTHARPELRNQGHVSWSRRLCRPSQAGVARKGARPFLRHAAQCTAGPVWCMHAARVQTYDAAWRLRAAHASQTYTAITSHTALRQRPDQAQDQRPGKESEG